MPFEKAPGLKGLIYVPEKKPGRKKHACPDCLACQFCSEERCRLCRGTGSRRPVSKNKKPPAGR